MRTRTFELDFMTINPIGVKTIKVQQCRDEPPCGGAKGKGDQTDSCSGNHVKTVHTQR